MIGLHKFYYPMQIEYIYREAYCGFNKSKQFKFSSNRNGVYLIRANHELANSMKSDMPFSL